MCTAVLGGAASYNATSPLLTFRLGDESQADWKEEVGHYLRTAERHGYLERLSHDALAEARRRHGSTNVTAPPHANEKAHLKLRQALAPAMLAHYLLGTGWGFLEWEPKNVAGDIDLRLSAPGGAPVAIQAKAPDQPGGRGGGRVIDGEHDDRVVAALEKATRQLPKVPTGPQLVSLSAQRLWSLATNPECVTTAVYGTSVGFGDGQVYLPREKLGRFPAWPHVSGVVLLDYVRSPETLAYACTVLLNPWCRPELACAAEWFPHARVCHLIGDRITWIGGAPDRAFLPEGTRLVDSLPAPLERNPRVRTE